MPRVSIVIPTRNRGHLLEFALKSAVNQDYSDFEIIVCDNFSADNTKEVVKSFNQNNVVYVRTDKPLSMPDNWERALAEARGEYITYLTDDAYLLPDCISAAMRELERSHAKVAVWRHCAYFASDWPERGRRNILYIPRVTNKCHLLTSHVGLRQLYTDPQGQTLPKSLNSLCHRSIIERAMSVQGRFFLPSCPDYSSAASLLLNVPDYLFIDQFLFIDGVTPSSIGATSELNLGPSTQNFINEFPQQLEDMTFLGILTTTSAIAFSLEGVRKYYSDTCPAIDCSKLLCNIADRLTKLDGNGVNVREDWLKLEKYLATQPMDVRLSVKRQKILSRLIWTIVRKIRESPRLEFIETLRNIHILKGRDWNFKNIEECAAVVAQRRQGARQLSVSAHPAS